MLDMEDEVAFAIWTAATGNAYYLDWVKFDNRDLYIRMAKAAIRKVEQFKASAQ